MATYPEFKSPLTQVWQYLGRNLPYFKKVLGIIQEPVGTTGFDLNCASSCNRINNYTLTLGGVEYDVYRLQGAAIMSDPAGVYVRLLGSITTSSPVLTVIKNSSNVQAFDVTFQDTHTALGTGALVQNDSTGYVIPVQLMFVNTDNTPTTPDEYFFYAVAADSVPFNCSLAIDLDVAVLRGSTVTYSTL